VKNILPTKCDVTSWIWKDRVAPDFIAKTSTIKNLSLAPTPLPAFEAEEEFCFSLQLHTLFFE
jgi:hypothetical protein